MKLVLLLYGFRKSVSADYLKKYFLKREKQRLVGFIIISFQSSVDIFSDI